MKSKVKYRMPIKNEMGIVKDYQRITVDVPDYLVGSVGAGVGGGLSLSIQDMRELENLISALSSARDILEDEKASSMPYGEHFYADIFKTSDGWSYFRSYKK
tara:strand:+ start:873 stop:1178 length:306 start_codon:yes stop_codon:yes gene_type:complete